MKKTAVLEIIYSQHLPTETLIMHPNEGFDIGLMTKSHALQWCTNLAVQDFLQGQAGDARPIQVSLLNECPPKQIQMNIQHGKQIGMPKKAVMLFDGQRVFLHSV